MRLLQTSLLLFWLPISAWALPSDREKPINIEADHAQMDDASGVAQYKGDAILTQGTLRIEGDIITFYYDENKELKKAVAEGKLATYKQVHKPGEEPVRARALRMDYYAGDEKIYLIGQGYVWQNGDEFKGNRIEYDIAKNVVFANSAPVEVDGQKQTSGRVHVTIQPPGQREKQPAPANNPTPAEPISAPEQTSETTYPKGVIETALNVRTGPGVQYEKLSTFAANTEVLILTRQNDWAQVKGFINGEAVIGWINQRYIKEN
ncbi:lipopolysaccharide transport periplasmic protein LptA [Methylophaga sp. OBS3]|uniref:lipopolysaccharide transport periplasmic protein LptA n=1 Tax=Methylophaga sp. OBS3 TaxID=2991934 RepID=UPI00225025F3|nr:lipopolysaccharide transport periplasmic protein LptA [Methylophaga sp. OBS3]MCX4190559.1 lipopolysaccharide transport periplasmic protein LptA [Methylophaga sp. OBS3]